MIDIAEGKYYRTRDGRKVGPMEKYGYQGFDWAVDGGALMYDSDGRRITKSPHDDLIAEWTDGPVRTVTRTVTEIVPGEYGPVSVRQYERDPDDMVRVSFFNNDEMYRALDSGQLRAAAAVLLELAGALEE